MLQSPISPSSYSLRGERTSKRKSIIMDDAYDDEEEVTDSGKARTKSRRELPTGAVATLKAWLLSPEHFTHPYPTPQDQQMLMQKTGIDKKQLKNWFTNARRRIWKPMLKKQIEQGKLTGAAIPPGMLVGNSVGMDNPHSVQAMRVHYQQAIQGDPAAGNTESSAPGIYPGAVSTNVAATTTSTTTTHFYDPASQPNSSINTLARVSSEVKMNKTDSHAVLMELFARDQDLVRQATESRLKDEQPMVAPAPTVPPAAVPAATATTQHPMLKAPSSSVLHNVPTLNSWPHFSSITSLNNLGTLPGVKSIASLSGQDLASKGNVNKMGNLAQVKSMESMGKNDSYAFLEVFFGDRSSTNLSGMPGARAPPVKTEEDNEIGLSLDDESSPSQPQQQQAAMKDTIAPLAPSIPSVPTDTGTLKRAYDDAMAARGLLAVSRSCEKLTDLVLPAKIQRTLSQEFVTKQQQPEQQQPTVAHAVVDVVPQPQLQQQPGQQTTASEMIQDPLGPVQVASTAICVICKQPYVDTQLRPCGHMFHERCLKPSFTNPVGQPKCPIDGIPITSAVLAVPDQEQQQQQ